MLTTSKPANLDECNYETVSLVWLDAHVEALPEYAEWRAKLRSAINYVKLFGDVDQCELYVRTTSADDRIVLLVDYPLVQAILSRVHSLRQTSWIYVYNPDVETDRKWMDSFPKIKCSSLPLCELISQIQLDQLYPSQHRINDPFPLSAFNPNGDPEQTPLDPADPFFSSRLIVECLVHPELNCRDRAPLIAFCREIYADNPSKLNDVEEFERTYVPNEALSWYTKNSFLTRILNKALRVQKIDVLLLFQFFLVDIRRQLEHKQQLSALTLYRSLALSDEELQIFKDSPDGFVSIHTFLLAKLTEQQALLDLDGAFPPTGLHRVLLAINADPRLDRGQPFAMLNSSEALFMTESIFRVLEIHSSDEHTWLVRLALASPTDERLISPFHAIKRQTGYNSKQIDKLTLGHLLWRSNKLDDAEKYYRFVIDRVPTDKLVLANIYYTLGHIHSDKRDYEASLKCYQQSLAIWTKQLKRTDPKLADNYNAIATNYWKTGNYQGALDAFQQALELFQQAYGDNHMSVAMCLSNMGAVMSQEKNYSDALEHCLKALAIFEEHLPSDHPNLASLHCNVSSIYKNLEQVDSALEHLKQALTIYESALPAHHPTIVMMLKNIAALDEQKEEYAEALTCYRRMSDIYRRTSTTTDPMVVRNEEKIHQLLTLQQSKPTPSQ